MSSPLDFIQNLGIDLNPMQRVVVKALYHLPLEEDADLVDSLWKADRLSHHPSEWESATGVLATMPRRSGKSYLAACLMAYESPGGLWATVNGDNQKAAEEDLEYFGAAGIVTRSGGFGGLSGRALAVMDEFAYYWNPEDTWKALSPCVSQDGRLLGVTSSEGGRFRWAPQSVLQIWFPTPAEWHFI